MKKSVKKNKIKIKKINEKAPIIHAIGLIVAVAFFFSFWIYQIGLEVIHDSRPDIFTGKFSKQKIKKAYESEENNNGAVYENSELGFSVMLPDDENRYAVKEVKPKGANRAIIFGLPTNDEAIKKIKEEDYSEIFRIELVPVSSLMESKVCSDNSREFPLCDNDDLVLGQNEQYIFVYTRYDKLDAVEKNRKRFIPNDFSLAVFDQADEIAKSFRLVSERVGLVN